MRTLLALVLALSLTACGASEKQRESGMLRLGQTATLAYEGIDSRLTANTLSNVFVPEGPRPPAGQHYVGIALRWVDNGKPFPHEYARFTLVDDHGRSSTGAVLSPLKKTFPDKPAKGQPQTQVVALPVIDGREPKTLKLTSVVKSTPFAATWSLQK